MYTKATPTQRDEPTTQATMAAAEQTAVLQQRVLVADDDPHVRQLLELVLSDDGYEVISASNGHELVRMAQEHTPGLILVDLMMPQMDGFEAIRQMRNDSRTAHIPMLILTARSLTGDVVTGFETGADDYIAKPFNISELLARVKSHLRRAAQRPVLNPLTGLPSGVLLSQELRRRLAQQSAFALLYADLDNFKVFNDTYGFSRGDRAIILVASILQRVLATHGNAEDFIGHIGGDDFAVLTTPERSKVICRAVISVFDDEIRSLYSPEDRVRGYFSAVDRHGVLRRFGLMSISIGVVSSERRSYAEEEEFTRIAAEMKHYAKTRPGSTFAVDKRAAKQSTDIERRGARQRAVLIVSDDSSLRVVLRTTLQEDGYLVMEADNAEILRQPILADDRPPIMIADAQLGEPLWALCTSCIPASAKSLLVVLAHDDDHVAQARVAGAAMCLRQPLPLAEIVACVDQLITAACDLDEETPPVDNRE
jgi:diguanylate cyclase (GGDEF)-like protein